MNTAKDKRGFPRIPVSLNVHIQDGETRTPVEMVDLTVHGISFKLDHSLSVGGEIFVSINDSEEIRHNSLKAKVLRCDKLKDAGVAQYLVAAKFLDANDEYLMDSLALVHSKPEKFA